LIMFAWIPFAMIPMMFMDGFEQQHMQPLPIPIERMVTEPISQMVPAPGFEDVPEMIVVSENGCDPSYPEFCIPLYPPDLDCGEIQYANFKVLQPDPHGFDRDKDGIGCES